MWKKNYLNNDGNTTQLNENWIEILLKIMYGFLDFDEINTNTISSATRFVREIDLYRTF